MDERDIFDRFHSAFDVQPPAGAAQRLRATLLNTDGLRLRQSAATRPDGWRSPLGLRVSLRLATGLLLVVVGFATTGVFVATHRSTATHLPDQSVPSPNHAVAGNGPGPDMVNSTTGWAVGTADVWRTTDGGVQWTSVRPRGAPLQTVVGSYFMDATHAWVLAGSDQLITYRTADGGRTWDVSQSGVPSSKQSRPVLYFLDGSHGWMLLGSVSVGVVPSSEQLLFATHDGGQHWARLASNPPTSGCTWLSVAFASLSDGWMTLDCNVWVMGGSGFLLSTHDGGITWSAQDLPLAPGSPIRTDPETGRVYTSDCPVMGPENSGVATCHAGPLVVFDNRRAVMLIWSEASVPGLLVVTSDDGSTWTSRSMPDGSSSISFVDPEHWWAFGGSSAGLFRTDDGGLNWVPVHAPAGMAVVRFVDSDNGFAITHDSQLWRTRDQGDTWTLVARAGPYGSPCFGYAGVYRC